ncbi:hypothetical protein V6N12_061932 [Hibiscus sabdariffa]|uniref:Uncharacterized protein n=1 Tax=Hibiscus sabdariffa TaxID=183260 RepID=A0ABR2DYI4_9ROSI
MSMAISNCSTFLVKDRIQTTKTQQKSSSLQQPHRRKKHKAVCNKRRHLKETWPWRSIRESMGGSRVTVQLQL